MGGDPQKEVLNLLKDLKQQIGYLEKKIDALSGGSSARSSSKPRSYSSSSRSSSSRSKGGRPTSGGSRYKDKHESAYGSKKSTAKKWYEKKRGDDLPAGARKPRKSHVKKR